jgi:methylated-DNA-protein-cysteine methyltransferase related protein
VPKSPAFIRIREQVLQIVRCIPASRLCTYQAIGEHLDVMPRHVAYILSQLPDLEKMTYPWHRVVSGDGTLGTVKRRGDGRTQAELLADEGHVISGNAVVFFERAAIAVGMLDSGIEKQQRPASSRIAPAGPARRSRRSDR